MKPMKRLNPIQVAASAAGAVLSAVIASFFGVEGTIIGTAIGSIVATTVSALVWESIERGHDAVRQVVVRGNGPLVQTATTETAGEVTSADAQASAVEVQVDAGLDAQVVVGDPPGLAGGAGAATEGAAELTGPRRFVTSSRTSRPGQAPGARAPGGRVPGGRARSGRVRRTATSPEGQRRAVGPFRRRWVVAGSIVGVFVVALGVVTAIEVVAGRPLASILGESDVHGGTSIEHVASGTPGPTTSTTTAPSSTTSTTSTTTTTTTTTTTPSTTTTTATPSTTTTTTPSTTTTTTTPSTAAGASGATGGAGTAAG